MRQNLSQDLPSADDPRGIGALLATAASLWPDRLAVRSYEETTLEATFQDLDRRARGAAARLRREGVSPRDRVALISANCMDFVSAWFGIAYVGATVVPIPILSAGAELSFRVEHSGCRAVVFDAERTALVETHSLQPKRIPLPELARTNETLDPGSIEVSPDDAAMILYTSGTSGHPKGACISHRTLLAHAEAIGDHALHLQPEDRVLGVLPLTHSYGLRMVLLATLRAGCRSVLMPRFRAAESLDLMAREKITWVPAVPTMFSAWGAQDPGPPPPTLRWCLSAGSPLASEVLHRAEARLGAEIRQGYGMTEATFATINAPPDTRVIDSVGRPAHGIEVRTTNPEGVDVAAGETGEVWVRGHNLMSEYLDDPAGTDEALHDGWMHSGDIGRFDDEGRLYVVDRLKDMIIRGGNNVYPSEVEASLAEHPDIREVAVVGRPDPYYGEEIVALIALRKGSKTSLSDLQQWARDRVARNKVPREWAFVDPLPLGPSGKVLKRELRRQIAEKQILPTRP